MTRRGDKEASEKRSKIGEDERQPVMARLAARWRRSNLVELVTLRKGNHLGERKWEEAKKKIYTEERGAHEEAEIQRKALRCGKNSAISKDTCLEKERVRSKVTPRKV